ncbi:MAG: UDP-N-acetylmuramate dehydrogenase [Pyrinomonadaceae bacterium]
MLKDIPLAPLTTLKIGGPARFFVRAESEQQVCDAFEYSNKEGLDLFVLGGGSNILVADEGFDGLVLQIAECGMRNAESRPASKAGDDRIIVTAKAGEDWDGFVSYCVGLDLAGVECLSGIPGFVGGTPVQNVGAYGQEVSETIVSVRCLDRQSGNVVDLTNAYCGFEYRTSIFNTSMRDRYIVLAVTYSLVANAPPQIAYKDLKEFFLGREPTLGETREAVLRIRAAKSMVIDNDDPNSRSAGSFFKNPIVGLDVLAKIIGNTEIDRVPHFEVGADLVKIPAAWLIENAGFQKGFVMGNAGISTRHSLAIVNRGNATAKDIIALKDRIVAEVAAKFGIELRPEPIFVGF